MCAKHVFGGGATENAGLEFGCSHGARRSEVVMPNVRVEAGPAAKPQARTMENSASPLCGLGILMLGLASNEGLGVW